MCVGIPMKILSVDGLLAQATDGSRTETIDLALTGSLDPGTWVLGFLGSAREVISEDEAAKIRDALDGLASVMAGQGAGDAFADLEARGPQLPPHLQAAFEAGESKG